MWTFSDQSRLRLTTARLELVEIFSMALEISPVDFGISCGYRGQEEQTVLYSAGLSKMEWPQSKHNRDPAEAVDFYPYVAGEGAAWKREELFYLIAGLVLGIGHTNGVRLRWGGAWRGPLNREDEFQDLPHIEILI